MKRILDKYALKYKKLCSKKGLLCLFAIIMPFIFSEIIMRLNGYGLFQVIPYWNDEANYYLQLKSMLEYGAPLGYNGYNGETARFLTFGFHGFGVLIPHYLFSKIFGLSFYTITLVNLLMLSISIWGYIYLVRPNNKQISFIVACSSIAVYYSYTAMMEVSFYAYMLLYASICIRISKDDALKFKILGFIFILFISFSKPTLAIFILPLLTLIIQTKNLIMRFTLSILGMSLFTLIMQYIFNLFSSPFYISHFAYDWSLIKEEPFGTIITFFKNIFTNFFKLLTASIDNYRKTETDYLWIICALLMYITILCLTLITILFILKQCKSKLLIVPKETILLYSTSVVALGNVILWTAVLSPFVESIRNCLPMLFFVFTILSTNRHKKISRFIGFCAVICSLAMSYDATHMQVRKYVTQDFLTQVQGVEDFYDEYVVISSKKSPWENTIASYLGTPDRYWLNAPAGVGWNLYLEAYSVNEKYVLMPHYYLGYIDYYSLRGYTTISLNEDIILMQNPLYE